MGKSSFILLSLTAIVAGLAAALAFVVLRLFAAAKQLNRTQQGAGAETAFMAAAMEEAVAKLRSREQAMVARAEASERLSDEIIANLTAGLLVVGDDRRVKSLNPAGRRLLGLPDREPAGRLNDVLATAEPLARVIEECMDGGQAIRRRAIRIDSPSEGDTHLGVSVSPIGAGDGGTHGAICLFSDLTDVVQLEEQLRLKDGLAQVGELTAGIAHEFRNGLATIHGYARLLDLERLPTDMRAYVTGIREETDTLGAVVRNFLNFAKPTELVLGNLDVRTIVERAADDIRAEATEHGGTVTVSGEFVDVPGDEVLLRQALNNLARNALEACTEAPLPPHILFESAVDRVQRCLRISIVDSGPGVDAKLANKIFQPFVTTRARGTGLGLAVVQKIVVSHNGRVTLQAEPDAGARFTITLPLHSDTALH